ncbi:MAG: spore coat protein CotJB [Coprobacillaceae bacterium]
MDNRQNMLYDIMLFDFAVQDSSLFLDTHPDDVDAFAYYKEASNRLKKAREAYTNAYGPLDNRDAIGNNYSYVNGPWPWEGK